MERRPLQPILGREGVAPTAYAARGGDPPCGRIGVSPGNSETRHVEGSTIEIYRG